jgi:hypothetical protein
VRLAWRTVLFTTSSRLERGQALPDRAARTSPSSLGPSRMSRFVVAGRRRSCTAYCEQTSPFVDRNQTFLTNGEETSRQLRPTVEERKHRSSHQHARWKLHVCPPFEKSWESEQQFFSLQFIRRSYGFTHLKGYSTFLKSIIAVSVFAFAGL